jgi:adenylate cyclase
VEVTTEELDAERGTLFLNDAETGELFSRVAQGNIQREIRFLNHTGIAGHVFTTGEPVIIADAYADARFNRSIDEQTGFVTRNILCVPIKTFKGEIIGVSQTLNKRRGKFTRNDLQLLEALTTQGTLALQSARFLESMKKIRRQEMEFIDVVSEVTADIKLGSLLQKVMGEATRLLNAERSTLFLNDEKTGELWSEVGQGLESLQIRCQIPPALRARCSLREDHQHPVRLRRPALQSGLRQEDRLFHAVDPVRADCEQGRQDHRRDAGAEQARRPVQRGG